MDESYKKSHTFSMDDEDWKQVIKAAKRMGFKKRKGMAIAALARKYNEEHEASE